jgi:murein DD-endopeptidase MepM/ murein hydrolase activator NlpD
MPAHLVKTALRIVVLALCGWRTGIAAEAPRSYLLDYPPANRFVPPIEGFFEEVASTIGRVGRRTFRHQPNGGYGLAIRERVGGKNLLHLGADVGWYRVGEPVVAVADGVVRVAQQPLTEDDKRRLSPAGSMEWGGVVAVEHRLPDDSYVTTIYGHLDPELLVSTGDVVKAGQQIGTIGSARVNGGYKPHLHFAVRSGRRAEKGRRLITVHVNDRLATLTIQSLTEKAVVLTGAEELPELTRLRVGDKVFEVRKRNGTAEVDADILWHIQPPDFAIVGYGLSTEGWRDPVAFLREPTDE